MVLIQCLVPVVPSEAGAFFSEIVPWMGQEEAIDEAGGGRRKRLEAAFSGESRNPQETAFQVNASRLPPHSDDHQPTIRKVRKSSSFFFRDSFSR